MNCKDCGNKMDELYYSDYETVGLYECPICDHLEMPENVRSLIRESLIAKGLKERTVEFDSEVQRVCEEIRGGKRKYNVDLPPSNPTWEDPSPDDDGFGM